MSKSKEIAEVMKKYNGQFIYSCPLDKIKDYTEVRKVFLLNLDHSKLFRDELFGVIYGKEAIEVCNEEWNKYTKAQKEEWYDLQTNNKNTIGDFAYTMLTLKNNNLNIIKTFRELKAEGRRRKLLEKYKNEQ